MTRAVWATERHQDAEYAALYRNARAAFDEAIKLDPAGGGVVVVIGDRLAPEDRAESWALAYESYHTMWKQQSATVEKLPVSRHFVDEISRLLPETPYEARAKKWSGAGSMACMTCHEEARLAARTSALAK